MKEKINEFINGPISHEAPNLVNGLKKAIESHDKKVCTFPGVATALFMPFSTPGNFHYAMFSFHR